MSGPADAPRRSLPARLVPGPVRVVARHAWGTFRYAPILVKLLLVIIVVGGPGALVYRYAVHRNQSIKAGGQVAEWRRFEEAVRTADEPKMLAALDGVLARNPTDPTALGRKQALESGQADPGDQPMVVLSVRRHLRAGRLADADREAKKRLASEKNDWLSRCVVAAHRLQQGDAPGAAAELDQLPAPGDATARLDPGGLLFAARLFRATGKDLTPLRRFAQTISPPILRAAGSAHLPPAEKSALVECYVEAFDPTPGQSQPAGVAEAWAAAAKLADSALDEALEHKDPGVLTRLGRLGVPLEAGLGYLRRSGQVTADEARPLAGDLRDRTRKAWDGVLAADGGGAEAHRGKAGVLLRAAADAGPGADRPALYRQARDTLVAGLQAKPDDPELAQMFGRLLAVEGRPLDAAQYLIGQAHAHPDHPVWWALAAEAAVAASRRELALEACAKLRAKDPNNRWAARTEGRLWVDAGEPARALPALARLGDDAVARDPLAAYPFARALAETGAGDRLTQFLQVVAAAGQPAAAGAAARGLADADPAKFPPADLQARAVALLNKFPDHPDLLRAEADAAYRLAERGDPLWDPTRVRTAVRAVEQALRRNPDDPELCTHLGWLRLSGESNPALAARAVAPLLAPDARPTPRQLELLGAVALAANDLPAATGFLQRATQGADPPAGAFALLARAHHAAGRAGPARSALDAARSRPHTPRERADYLTTAKLVAAP